MNKNLLLLAGAGAAFWYLRKQASTTTATTTTPNLTSGAVSYVPSKTTPSGSSWLTAAVGVASTGAAAIKTGVSLFDDVRTALHLDAAPAVASPVASVTADGSDVWAGAGYASS